MAVIAEFRVPAGDFLLSDALRAAPEMHVEVRRVVAEGATDVTPYFWAWGGDFDTFEATLADDETVQDVSTLDASDEAERVYRARWEHDGDRETVVHAVAAVGATVLHATAADAEWDLRVLFPDDDALTAFHDAARDLSLDVVQLFHPHDPEDIGAYDVTTEQREALVVAHDAGYFSVPREATLAEVADRLGVSENAASARLRRAHDNLVGSTVAAADRPG